MNKFEMEMLFEYPGEDGSQCLGWYHGRVDKLISERNHSVLIKWDEDCLGPNEQRVSKHKLVPSNWNPKKAKKGAWGKYMDL